MKKFIAMALAIALTAALAIGGTTAYLTSQDSDVNVMTLGNVKIQQIEQQKAEDGSLEPFQQAKEFYPGTGISKIVTVKNTGKSDAYFRTLIAFEDVESDTFEIDFPISEGGYKWSWGQPEATIVIDGTTYQVYEALYTGVLAAGETSPASLTKVELAASANNEDMDKLGETYDILVLSQAVQSDGFTDAATALDTAFGDVNEENALKWFSGMGNVVIVDSLEELADVFANGGTAILTDDVEFEKILAVEPGADVYLNLNGNTITVDENTTSNTLIYVKDGAKLTIDGNGTIDLGAVSTMAIFAPYGELVIENGTFIRDEVTVVTNKTTGLFMGAKSAASNVTINGGHFDPGYYDGNAADIEAILAGTKTFTETADDIARRGQSSDKNLVRTAIKDNVSVVLNHSGYGSFKVYGGTFVGANPAWGDEGCMMPTAPNYLRPWSYYQGALLAGQVYNENGIVLPDGYTITYTLNENNVPVYTVNYSK